LKAFPPLKPGNADFQVGTPAGLKTGATTQFKGSWRELFHLENPLN
jgi:hypothetical protein